MLVLFLLAAPAAWAAAAQETELLRLQDERRRHGYDVYRRDLWLRPGEDGGGRRRGAGRSARLDELLSNYRPESEWSEVNRLASTRPVETSPELFRLLAACLEYSRESEGAFDITVGPLMKVWGFYKATGHLPHRAEVSAAMAKRGIPARAPGRDAHTVRFDRAGVELDPGGIGKGYAVDRMVDILRQNGVTTALVAGSGSSIYGMGAPPGEPRGWRVNIKNPWSPSKTAVEVYLKDESVSTSGSYEKFFRAEGRIYAHIMDPRTGYPAQGSVSVSVVAPAHHRQRGVGQAVFRERPPVDGPAQTKGISRILLRRQDGSAMRVAPMTSRFLDACRRRPTEVRPVWFMRQAGRYLKQYRQIRDRHGILEICKRPDLAATVTLQPVELLDVDAAIIFADLLLPVEPMGLKLRYAVARRPRDRQPRAHHRRRGFALDRQHR